LSYTFYNNDLATAKLGSQSLPIAARSIP
jgi:hypothetical protein